jgi:hypothetical protein
MGAVESSRPVRPAPIVPIERPTKVVHRAPGHEDYFGPTPAAVDVYHYDEDCALFLEGDWT